MWRYFTSIFEYDLTGFGSRFFSLSPSPLFQVPAAFLRLSSKKIRTSLIPFCWNPTREIPRSSLVDRFLNYLSVMAEYLNDDLEYVVEEYFDMGEFDDEFEMNGHQREGRDADLVEDEDPTKQKNDTSASEYRTGKDIQGIPWERLNHSREKYREVRLKLYKNYQDLSRSRDELEKECKQVERSCTFYDFQFNTRLVKPTIVHFQLRNILWATSKHDVYLMQNYSVMHWSSLLRRGKEVLNVAGQIVPAKKHPGSLAQSLSRVQISTMVVKDNLMAAGGFQGELICKYLNQPGVTCTKITTDANAITNAVDIYQSSNGSNRVMTANNDCCVRVFDTEKFMLLNHLSFSWSVNSTSASPDGKLLAVLGDNTDCLLADSQTGKVIGSLKGHLDYSFASAWHPDGHILATGNQDKTCRLWDVRNLSQSLAVLKGRMGAIRGIKFSADGRFMAMAEPADFVHIYDTRAAYGHAQEIGRLPVIRDRKWKDVAAAFNFPSTITNASFVLRKYYMSLLRSYEQVYYFGNKGSSIPVSAGKPVSKSEPLNPQAGMIIASPTGNPVSGSEASLPQVSATLTEDSGTRDQPLTGFEHPHRVCCGYGGGEYNYDFGVGCIDTGEVNGTTVLLGKSCKDPSKSIIWDGAHYTEAANRWVFDQIKGGAFSDPPVPLSMACHREKP